MSFVLLGSSGHRLKSKESTTKNHLVQNIGSAEVETPCFIQSHQLGEGRASWLIITIIVRQNFSKVFGFLKKELESLLYHIVILRSLIMYYPSLYSPNIPHTNAYTHTHVYTHTYSHTIHSNSTA